MASIDWCAFTVKDRELTWVLAKFGHVAEGWLVMGGHYGYRKCHVFGGVRVYSDGSEGMGVHVQVSGEGCGLLASAAGWCGWVPYLSSWLLEGVSFTRIDVAFDWRGPGASMKRIHECRECGALTCRWETVEADVAYNGQEVIKDVVYFGRMCSDSCLCVYDKALERRSSGEECDGPWVRFELRYKRSAAVRVVEWLCGGRSVSELGGLLAAGVAFRELAGDSNVSRRPVASWYREVVEGCSRETLPGLKRRKPLVERAMHWVKQHAAAFVLFMLAFDAVEGRGAFCRLVIEEGWQRCSDARLSEIGSYTHVQDYQAALRAWRKDRIT